MRIGFVSTYPPIECGIGTYTEALNNALRKLRHETFVVSRPGAHGAGVVPAWRPESSSFAADAFEVSASLTPDLMHIQHEYGMYGPQKGVKIIELILRYRLAGVPVAITLHTVYDELDEQEQIILKHIVDESSAVIVHESFQKEVLRRHFGAGDKIHVIEHGVREIKPIPAAKEKLGLEGKKVVLICGYYRPTKGYHRVLSFFPEICAHDPDAVLVVAGKARSSAALDHQRQLLAQMNESPVVDRIVFLRGQFPQHTFDTILSAADCVVLPYEQGAQSGLLAQCFAHGRPAIVSDLRAFRLLVERSGGGLVCGTDEEYVSSILRVLNDQQLRRRMRASVTEYVREKAGWSQTARQHAALYSAVIEPYGKGRYVYFPEPNEPSS
jgi:glycosyltransferase involved in cell wall biosynthesis